MARKIVEAGHPLTLWARRPETLKPFAETSASLATSPRKLGESCDLVCVCVVDEAGVREVLMGDDGVLAGLPGGAMIAVHSTISPAACTELAAAAEEVGVDYIDAPVSGGGQAAAAGQLLVMVGASAPAQQRCRPVFETFGDPVLHVGDVGAAQRVKLINNAMMAAHTAVAAHALEVADAVGVERSAVAAAIHHGSGQSRALDLLGQFDFRVELFPANAFPLLRKDVALLLALDDTKDGSAAEALAQVSRSLLDERNLSARG
jgi:3-hydroxyisobutyrate dehydrogenase-like beta-hydroxyacid dehydrogenase